ncbi:MAG: hypothetical protein LBT26_06535 [Clostridiales Family XIII bacterium]|jgi:hypothetical protein|nr:hypothetical protein [Clostridiales Family XIII bacterium]
MNTYRNEGGEQLSDITTAIFIDLTQAAGIAKKQVPEMTAVEQWAVFLAKANDPGHRELINEIFEHLTRFLKEIVGRCHARLSKIYDFVRATAET